MVDFRGRDVESLMSDQGSGDDEAGLPESIASSPDFVDIKCIINAGIVIHAMLV